MSRDLNTPSDLIFYFKVFFASWILSVFHHYALQHKRFSISVLFFLSYYRLRAEWRLTGDWQLLCACMSCAAVCENHVKGVASLSKCISDDMLGHGHVWWGTAEQCGAVRVGLGRVITDMLWGKDILHQRITSVHSHTPVPTLTFPTLILSDILGTRLCVIEAKREKWDMKCQLFWLWLCQAYPADKTGVYSLIQLPFLWRTKHGGFVYLVKIELLLGLLTLVSWLPFSASSWDRCRTLIV